jgi:hypothetical protein
LTSRAGRIAANGDQHGRDDGGRGGHPEHHGRLTGDGRGDPADGRADHQAAHLCRPVEPERLALALRRVGIDEVAPRCRVVDRGRQAGQRPGRDEGQGADREQGHHGERGRQQQPDDHHQLPRGPVGNPAEHRFADQPSRRPGGDDHAQRGQVDTVPGEVDRQDRQQRAEADPDGSLGDEQREDRAPGAKPGPGTFDHGGPAAVCDHRSRG